MTHREATFQAALVRVLLALAATVLLPQIYPRIADKQLILVAYTLAAIAMQALVWKNIAPQVRPVVTGIIDLCFITWIVHRVGSVSTIMVALYAVAATMNALVVTRRIGLSLALTGTFVYAATLIAESRGLLPYGPDAPAWAPAVGPPDLQEVLAATVFVGTLMNVCAFLIGRLVQTIRDHESELEELSQRDPLTQLYNRRHLLSRIDRELARRRRGHPLSLVMIDLDGFKRVNDGQGHLRGDALLIELAEALSRAVRETDVVGRYGGDEFLVVLPDTLLADAHLVADRMRSAIQRIGEAFDPAAPVTASIGIAIAAAEDAERTLVQRADQSAYRAKRSGGNRVVADEGDGAQT